MKKSILSLALAVIMVMALLTIGAFADGTTLTVGEGKTYETISDALANAKDGDTIVLEAGNYDIGSLNIKIAVNIQGAGHEDTILEGGILYKNSTGDVSISGVTLEATTATSNKGLGFSALKDGQISVENCTFNGYQFGIGINSTATGNELVVSNSQFVSVGCAAAVKVGEADNSVSFNNVNTNGGFAIQAFNGKYNTENELDGYYYTYEKFAEDAQSDFENAEPDYDAVLSPVKLVTPSTDIQNVINKAEEGSTIYFAPGTYTGNVTFGGKSLTLKGANAGVNPNTETRGEESVITGTFSTSREKLSTEAVAGQTIIIDGFKFTGNGLKVGDCNYNTVEYLTVQNCIMEAGTNLDASTLVNTYGSNIYNYFVKVTNGSGARATVTVQNNLITGEFDKIDANNGVYPIQLWYVKGATVTGNVIALENTDDIHQAINISKLAADAEVIVKDNVISGAAGGIYVTTWACGGDTTGGTDFEGKIEIVNNYLTGAGTGNFEPIFVGYEAEGHGAFNGTLIDDNNTNNGVPVAAEVGQKPGSTGYYTVTVMSGNSVVDAATVESGTEYTLPNVTNSGYIFLGWRDNNNVTHKAGEVLTITADTTFTAVWGNLPDVKPSEPETPETPVFPFYDVTARDWYYSAVKYVYEKGLMDGVDVGVFAPNDTLTRAMVWTIIARAEGVDTTGGATWYAKAQEWVTAKGISDGENPSAAITRQELVTMLYRLAGEPAVSGTITAPDAASVSTWATDAMTWAMNIGLVEGDENGAVTPTATATRAQAAALIMRYLEA